MILDLNAECEVAKTVSGGKLFHNGMTLESRVGSGSGYRSIKLISECQLPEIIPYTRVNKRMLRMRLFAKLQGNMRLIAKGKFDHTSKTVMPSLVARVLDSK